MKKLLYILTLGMLAASLSVMCSAADTAGKVVTRGGRLNIRSSPSGTVIASAENSSWLTLKGESDGWYRVEYADGRYGWCSGDYIKRYDKTYEMSVAVTSGHLNVRSGAGTSYSVLDRLGMRRVDALQHIVCIIFRSVNDFFHVPMILLLVYCSSFTETV